MTTTMIVRFAFPGVRVMDGWISQLLCGIAGIAGGSLGTFALKWKAGTNDAYQAIINDLRMIIAEQKARGDAREVRMDNFERRMDEIQNNHLECEKKHAKMEGKLEILEKYQQAQALKA